MALESFFFFLLQLLISFLPKCFELPYKRTALQTFSFQLPTWEAPGLFNAHGSLSNNRRKNGSMKAQDSNNRSKTHSMQAHFRGGKQSREDREDHVCPQGTGSSPVPS